MDKGQGMQPGVDWSLRPLADMSAAEFNDWQTLLEERSGLVVTEQRRIFLQTNLSRRMREVGAQDYASYYRQVTDGPRGAVEWSTLMDSLTVQETRFFRHPPSFAMLSDYIQQRVESRNAARPWGALVVQAARKPTRWRFVQLRRLSAPTAKHSLV